LIPRKKILDFLFITRFLTCVCFAISAAPDDLTTASDRHFLQPEKTLLSTAAILLCASLAMRAPGIVARISAQTASRAVPPFFPGVAAPHMLEIEKVIQKGYFAITRAESATIGKASGEETRDV